MTAEFDWWLLILGLVIGAGLVWLILAELPRRDAEIDQAEIPVEAAWIAAQLDAGGLQIDSRSVEAVLRRHRDYLRLPPPDEAPPTDLPLSHQGASPPSATNAGNRTAEAEVPPENTRVPEANA